MTVEQAHRFEHATHMLTWSIKHGAGASDETWTHETAVLHGAQREECVCALRPVMCSVLSLLCILSTSSHVRQKRRSPSVSELRDPLLPSERPCSQQQLYLSTPQLFGNSSFPSTAPSIHSFKSLISWNFSPWRSSEASLINFCRLSILANGIPCLSLMCLMASWSSWYSSSCYARITAYCFVLATSVVPSLLIATDLLRRSWSQALQTKRPMTPSVSFELCIYVSSFSISMNTFCLSLARYVIILSMMSLSLDVQALTTSKLQE